MNFATSSRGLGKYPVLLFYSDNDLEVTIRGRFESLLTSYIYGLSLWPWLVKTLLNIPCRLIGEMGELLVLILKQDQWKTHPSCCYMRLCDIILGIMNISVTWYVLNSQCFNPLHVDLRFEGSRGYWSGQPRKYSKSLWPLHWPFGPELSWEKSA